MDLLLNTGDVGSVNFGPLPSAEVLLARQSRFRSAMNSARGMPPAEASGHRNIVDAEGVLDY